MAVTYTPTTNFGAKDSLPQNDPDKVIKGSEFTTEFTALQTAFSLAAPAASPTFTGTVTIPTADINGGAIDGTTIGGTTPAAATFTSVTATTADINGGTIDGVTIGGSSAGAITGTTGQFNTSLNVDGTVTADGLTVDLADNAGALLKSPNDSSTAFLNFGDSTSSNSGSISYDHFSDAMRFKTVNTERLRLASNGDISFYEDTGTTPKFFWDASAESLGIGTSSLTSNASLSIAQGGVHVDGGASGGASQVILSTGASSGSNFGQISNTGTRWSLGYGGTQQTVGTEVLTWNSSGNVGIGTSSPDRLLHLEGADTAILRFTNTDTSLVADQLIGGTEFEKLDASGAGAGVVGGVRMYSEGGVGESAYMTFSTASSSTNDAERMRIDSSGNLLVGCTGLATDAPNVDGSLYTGGGNIKIRKGTSGFQWMQFYGTGVASPIGSISNVSNTVTSYNTSSDYRLKDVDGPITNSGAYIDALKPVQGSWKADGSRFIGLIAHEVQEVSETPIATGEKDGEEMQGMDYSAPELIANLIAEIQSLRARVAQLEGA